MRTISFTVYGTPKPQGSMKAFFRPGMKHAVLTSDNKALRPWRQEISHTATLLNEVILFKPMPVQVKIDFYLARPASIPKKRFLPTVKPDIDKLARAVLDGCTGIIFEDDSQVVKLDVRKFYGSPERAEITITDVCD